MGPDRPTQLLSLFFNGLSVSVCLSILARGNPDPQETGQPSIKMMKGGL